ncbi:methyltransferase [Cyanobacteria bacterium FACHB-63]|nr:methyltransferase [Cyanobacteria bacterium FACHB-63]
MSFNLQLLDRPGIQDLPYVNASLNYLIPMSEKPVYYIEETPPGQPQHSGSFEPRQVLIRDARSIVQKLSLDQEGFALINHQSIIQNFYDDEEVRRVYYPEAEKLLTELTGAVKVIVFDHNVRDAKRAQRKEDNAKEPVKRVHNDFTARSGYSRARLELAVQGIENIDELLEHRFSVVNVWRPIASPVQESPIAVCDAQSIAFTDLVPLDLVYRDRVGETYAITYNSAHRWFYFPQQKSDEALLIKCFDSAADGRARFAAHSAFDDPTSSPDAPPRESIELRTLIFYS